MPTPETLRVRIRLIAEFEQLAARLGEGDESAVDEAQDRLYGVALCKDTGRLALVMKALATVLNDMQDEIDRGGWKF